MSLNILLYTRPLNSLIIHILFHYRALSGNEFSSSAMSDTNPILLFLSNYLSFVSCSVVLLFSSPPLPQSEPPAPHLACKPSQ
jgi:hypothetical protein